MPPELDYATMSSDIILKGNLRKAKTWNKRFFVLKDGNPAQLEYYESKKKWKSNSGKPKRRVSLASPWNIDRKKDCKHEFLIVIFTEDEYITLAADSAEIQDQWMYALRRVVKPEPGFIMFRHVWHVNIDNKALEGTKTNPLTNLYGPHRICITNDQMVFVHSNSNGGSDFTKGAPVELSMAAIRAYGHKEAAFFIEPGRLCGIENGKLWMDLSDETMAYHMHQTIRNLSLAPRQDDSHDYRGRSYSSGSNSGRSRSIRSHHNHPPPSQIGLGSKVVNSSNNNRTRCDTFPVYSLPTVNDPRYRTGSEGEHTMKKPPRSDSLRSYNSSTRGRLRHFHSKRSNMGYQPLHTCHIHTSSLSGSCNGSSTASSAEHLNIGFCSTDGSNSMLAIPSTQNSGDEYIGVNIMRSENTLLDGEASKHESKTQINGCNGNYLFSNEIPDSCCRFCAKCFSAAPYFTELAPPPPDIDPPSNSNASSCNVHEYVNYSSHSRAQSADEAYNWDSASYLSVSPHPPSSVGTVKQALFPKKDSLLNNPPLENQNSATSPQPRIEEYTPTANKYPHQKTTENYQKSPNTIFAKFALIAGVSSENGKKDRGEAAATTVTSPNSSEKALSKPDKFTSFDYVPMRPFVPKQSIPQDISIRRRSVQDGSNRPSTSRSYRSSPLQGVSPPNSLNDLSNSGSPFVCLECQSQLFQPKSPNPDNQSNGNVLVNSKGYGSCLTLISDNVSDVSTSKTSSIVQSPLSESKSNFPDQNTTFKKSRSTHSFQQDKCASKNDCVHTNNSPSGSLSQRFDDSRYLKMNPTNGTMSRKNVAAIGSTDVADNATGLLSSTPPQYPHQKKGATLASVDSNTNSLDRTKRSPRNNRSESSGSRLVNSSNSVKRSQSMKHSNKTLNGKLKELSIVSTPTNTFAVTPPLSPGGEYVNLDYKKSMEQMNSPYIATSDDEAEPVRTPSQLNQYDSDYTVMSFDIKQSDGVMS